MPILTSPILATELCEATVPAFKNDFLEVFLDIFAFPPAKDDRPCHLFVAGTIPSESKAIVVFTSRDGQVGDTSGQTTSIGDHLALRKPLCQPIPLGRRKIEHGDSTSTIRHKTR